MKSLPVLFEIILPLEAFPANLATKSDLWTLVRPLVDHEVIWLGEPPLAVLAHELAFRPHLPSELATAHVVVNLHYRKHLGTLSL